MPRIWVVVAALIALSAAPAVAADFPVKAPILAPVVPADPWSGFYAGLNIGYSFGNANDDWNFFAPGANLATVAGICRPDGRALCGTGSSGTSLDGVIGGIQAGYNWRITTYLVGIEADFEGSGQSGSGSSNLTFPLSGTLGPGTITTTYSESLTWFGTLRGRVGYLFANEWLLYGTGGLAYGDVTTSGSATALGSSGVVAGSGACTSTAGGNVCPVANWSTGTVKLGWVAGGGLEKVIVGNWSWQIEFLHIDLGNVNSSFATLPGCFGTAVSCGPVVAGTGTISSHVTDNIIRTGFDYRFGP